MPVCQSSGLTGHNLGRAMGTAHLAYSLTAVPPLGIHAPGSSRRDEQRVLIDLLISGVGHCLPRVVKVMQQFQARRTGVLWLEYLSPAMASISVCSLHHIRKKVDQERKSLCFCWFVYILPTEDSYNVAQMLP